MASDRVIRIVLTGSSAGAVRALGQVDTAAKRTQGALERTHAAGQKISSVGRSMASIGLPLAAAGGYAVKTAMDFQKSMEMIHTQARASQGEVGRMSKALMQLAPSVAIGPNELAQGLFHIESTGARGASALRELAAAAQIAKIGNANLVDVTNGLNAIMVSGIKGIHGFNSAVGLMNATVGTGDMHMQDLADALGTGLLGPLKMFGVNVRDIGAALAVFGDNNIRGADAGTKLASAVRIMAAPAKTAWKWLSLLKMTPLEMADNMRKGGLIPALDDLKKHLAPFSPSQQGEIVTNIFGRKQSTGVLLLLSQLDRLRMRSQQVVQGTAGVQSEFRATQRTMAFKWDQLKVTLEKNLILLGNALMPLVATWLPKLTKLVTDVTNWFTKLPKPLKEVLLWATAFLAVGGPILMVFGKLVSAGSTVFGFFRGFGGLLTRVLPALSGGLGGLAGEAGAVRLGLLGMVGPIAAVTAAFGALLPSIQKDINNFKQNIRHPSRAVRQDLHSMVSGKQMGTGMPYVPGMMGPGGGINLPLVGHVDPNPVHWFHSLFGSTGGEVPGGLRQGVVHLATGGMLGGFGGGDRIPALLEAGEYVLNKSTTALLGPQFLNALNQSGSRAGTHAMPGTDAQPIVINLTTRLGSRVLAEEVVRVAAKRSALSGRYVSG